MEQITNMIERDGRLHEESKVGLNADQLKQLKQFPFKVQKEEQTCSVCLANLAKA